MQALSTGSAKTGYFLATGSQHPYLYLYNCNCSNTYIPAPLKIKLSTVFYLRLGIYRSSYMSLLRLFKYKT